MENGRTEKNLPLGIFVYHLHKSLTNGFYHVNGKQSRSWVPEETLSTPHSSVHLHFLEFSAVTIKSLHLPLCGPHPLRKIMVSPEVLIQQQPSSDKPQTPNTALNLKRVYFITQDATIIILHVKMVIPRNYNKNTIIAK